MYVCWQGRPKNDSSRNIHQNNYSIRQKQFTMHRYILRCIAFSTITQGAVKFIVYICILQWRSSDLLRWMRRVICHSNKGDTVAYFPGYIAFIAALPREPTGMFAPINYAY